MMQNCPNITRRILTIEIKTADKNIGKVVKELGQRLMGRGGCIYGEGTRDYI